MVYVVDLCSATACCEVSGRQRNKEKKVLPLLNEISASISVISGFKACEACSSGRLLVFSSAGPTVFSQPWNHPRPSCHVLVPAKPIYSSPRSTAIIYREFQSSNFSVHIQTQPLIAVGADPSLGRTLSNSMLQKLDFTHTKYRGQRLSATKPAPK